MRNSTKVILAAAMVAAMAAAGTVADGEGFTVYAIGAGGGGWVLSNATEAYFFIKMDERGYVWTGLEYPWFLIRRYIIGGFAGAEIPTERRAYLTVLRVTASATERHVLKLDREEPGPGSDPGDYTPLEGRVYGYCPMASGSSKQDGPKVGKYPDDGLCWWAGDHFEDATEEEKQRLHGVERLTKQNFENDESGWSRRSFGSEGPDQKVRIDVGDKFRMLATKVDIPGTHNRTLAVDLFRPGKPSERILELKVLEENVSRADYDRVFGRTK